jgi:hypothetical protein
VTGEPRELALTIAAGLIDPDHLDDIIHESGIVPPEREQEVSAALLELRQELLEGVADYEDDEQVALASIEPYLNENGQIDFARMKADSSPLKAVDYPELAAEFPEMFTREADSGEDYA